MAGYRWQREISKRRLFSYPLPEDKGINCCCPNKLIYPFPAQLMCEEDEYWISSYMGMAKSFCTVFLPHSQPGASLFHPVGWLSTRRRSSRGCSDGVGWKEDTDKETDGEL